MLIAYNLKQPNLCDVNMKYYTDFILTRHFMQNIYLIEVFNPIVASIPHEVVRHMFRFYNKKVK